MRDRCTKVLCSVIATCATLGFARTSRAAVGPVVRAPYHLADPVRRGVDQLGYELTPGLDEVTSILSREFELLVDEPRFAAEIQDPRSQIKTVAEKLGRWCEIITYSNPVDGPTELVDGRIADVLADALVDGARRSSDPVGAGQILQGPLVERLIRQEHMAQFDRLATYATELKTTYHALTFANARGLDRSSPDQHSREVRALTRTANILRLVITRVTHESIVPARALNARPRSLGLPTFRRHLLRINFEWTVGLDEMSEDLGASLETFLRATTRVPADAGDEAVATYALGRDIRRMATALARETARASVIDEAVFNSISLAFVDVLRSAIERSSEPARTHHALRAGLMLSLTFDQEKLLERTRVAGFLNAVGTSEARITQGDALAAWSLPRERRHTDVRTYADTVRILRSLTRHLRPPCERLLGAADVEPTAPTNL